MPYGWTTQLLDFEAHGWVEIRTFKATLRSMAFKNMDVQANRDAALTSLEDMVCPPPFDEKTRFPDQAIFVDLDHSYNSTRLRALVAASSYKDRQNEMNEGISTPNPAVETRLNNNMSDALLAFSYACNEMRQAHGGYDIEDQHIFGIYTRASFEASISLVWTNL